MPLAAAAARTTSAAAAGERQNGPASRLVGDEPGEPHPLAHSGVLEAVRLCARDVLALHLDDLSGRRVRAVLGEFGKTRAAAGVKRDLWPAPETVAGDVLYVVEGEPDAVTAAEIGLPAVAVPGAQAWRPDWAQELTARSSSCSPSAAAHFAAAARPVMSQSG